MRDPEVPELEYPDVTYADRLLLELGGTEIELLHAAGEAEGYTLIHLPRERIVWVGDLLNRAMPMVASPMKKVRDPVKWRDALERVRSLEPRVVINSVDPPKCGESEFLPHLDTYVEFLEFLHESVAREMNRGSSVDEALANIRLPEQLRFNPWLQQRYGSLEFAVRGLYHRYSGWFDQNGTHLRPAPAKDKASAFVEAMGGRERVLEEARARLGQGDYAVALEFVDLIIDGYADPRAHELKADILGALADLPDDNRLVGNMYRRLSINERGMAGVDYGKLNRGEE
jgi:alkyl sulfatase BDS1-like metallo-beta-lactamase superfamily hydrolase